MGSWKCRDAVPCVCKADWCSCGSSILRSKMRSKPFAATCLCHVVVVASPNCTLDVLNYILMLDLLLSGQQMFERSLGMHQWTSRV
uniref:Uncharacterized protein n=1 Tax=Aegilops tauschii subsp. strangulata TaxID=200361 RepID=A0A453HSY6_AEGTS